jgi:hypothetical protein
MALLMLQLLPCLQRQLLLLLLQWHSLRHSLCHQPPWWYQLLLRQLRWWQRL